MPVLIPGPEVGSDSLKVKFLMIFGRPKTGFFEQISGAPGYIPPIPASYQPRRRGDGDPGGTLVSMLTGSRFQARPQPTAPQNQRNKSCGSKLQAA